MVHLELDVLHNQMNPPLSPHGPNTLTCTLFSSESALTQRLSELESHPPTNGGGGNDIRRVRRERDELKEAVKSFEAELTQIQLDTKILADDRDNFKLLYEQVNSINMCQLLVPVGRLV